MVARRWLLLFGLAAAAAAGLLQVHSQPDSMDFISIDCGIPVKSSYPSKKTNLPYTSDAEFTDAGSNYNISAVYMTPSLSKVYHTVRSFPTGARHCYTFRSLVSGLKYLVRALFRYGNYDSLNRPSVFDLHIGVNFWQTVNVSDADTAIIDEVITVVAEDYLEVCLVNTGSGTPFISGLELRPLKNVLYPQANATQALVLLFRLNLGPTDHTTIYRYPDDPYDRIWLPWSNPTEWTELSTTEKVQNINNDQFEAPSAVMQTAITPLNSSKNLEFTWDAEPQPNNPMPGYITVMHFSELQVLTGKAVRQFYINLNGELWYNRSVTLKYLQADVIYDPNPNPYRQYNFSMNATANSTLPPIINAIEIFSVVSTANLATDAQDVSAMTAIKAKYQVKRNWMGDPCVPKTLAWEGLSCSYPISSPSRITSLNLSFSELSGDISAIFTNLKAVTYLDLSHNKLTGSIPGALSQLPFLTFLDLTGNQLNGSIPDGLLQRAHDGSLTLRYAGSKNNPVKPQNEASYLQSHKSQGDSTLQLETRQFTYNELAVITNNFQQVLGRGGFGYVYEGFLENGIQVAVKLRSQSSNQGVKEFLAEARTLTRIHHRNLVSMMGYCKDGEYLALVYEYMSEGTLQEHLRGSDRDARPLTWRQRLRIVLESAQGLEYLHRGCNPQLIHRDVKTNNIVLNANLEAKIADFGLTKAFDRDVATHISTAMVVGTPGYVDPEYHATMQLNEKSDVYSFGVVLLEVITAQPAILPAPESTHIVQWVRHRLARGNIEGVVDARMRGVYDVNSVWKAAEVALKCTAQASAQRSTMTDVVAQLQECLELENSRGGADMGHNFYSGSSDLNYMYTADQSGDMSQSSTTFEMKHTGRVPTMPTGPAVR